MKKKYEKVTITSKLLNKFLKSSSLKKDYLTEENTKKLIKKMSNKKYDIPEKMGLFREDNSNMPLYSYNGKISKSKERIIVYLHGGSYLEEAISFQIKFAMKIAKKSDSTLVFPIYPLAPKHTYKDAYQEMDELYKRLLKTNKKIIFLGDSAGGGLALSFSMYLKKNNIVIPEKILLLSPWLDLTLENPQIQELEKYDFCAIAGNKYAGELWAGNLDKKNYLVSPIYGNFNDLPEITIATGEFDIMQPDCMKLSNLLDKNNIKHNYIEYKEQCHDFGIFPTKEGEMLIEDFVKIILQGE